MNKIDDSLLQSLQDYLASLGYLPNIVFLDPIEGYNDNNVEDKILICSLSYVPRSELSN